MPIQSAIQQSLSPIYNLWKNPLPLSILMCRPRTGGHPSKWSRSCLTWVIGWHRKPTTHQRLSVARRLYHLYISSTTSSHMHTHRKCTLSLASPWILHSKKPFSISINRLYTNKLWSSNFIPAYIVYTIYKISQQIVGSYWKRTRQSPFRQFTQAFIQLSTCQLYF